jgi:hypothetical protein
MQTTPDNQNKERVLKLLAIGGFVALIIIIAWLGVQLVRVAPKAFTSLASIADVVYNYEDITIDIASNKAVANVGEAFGLSWHVPKTPGDFTFTYTCVDGVSIDVRTIGSDIETVDCEKEFYLGSVSGVDLSIHSEKTRFADIPYSIAFVPTNTNRPTVTATSTVTVVNPAIPAVIDEATTTPEVTPTPTPVPPAKSTSTPVTTKPPVKPTVKPVPLYTYTYAVPVSNPNGYIDLVASLVKVGTINNGTFITSGTIDNDTTAALLFAIKNTGTKTSNTFTYTVTLPDGTTYTSPVQDPLKPNERAQIALGFNVVNQTGLRTFSVTVQSTSETTTSNNTFTGSVTITD